MGLKLDTVPPLFLMASLAIALTGRLFFDYSITDALLYGSLVGFAPLAILVLLCIVIAVFFGGFNNDRPPCACGNCASNDYQYIRQDTEGFHYRCPACGIECAVKDNVFFLRNSEGALTPSQRQSRWGRWKVISE